MKFRLTALALALVMGALILTPLSGAAAAQAANPLKNIPVTGAVGGTQAFTCTLNVNSFSHKGNQILANGTLKGTLTVAGCSSGQ